MLGKTLNRFVSAFAKGMELADAEKPIARKYFPGIGPHEEDKTVKMVLREITSLELMGGAFGFKLQVSYPDGSKKRCDLQLQHGGTPLYVEVKMMRKLKLRRIRMLRVRMKCLRERIVFNFFHFFRENLFSL